MLAFVFAGNAAGFQCPWLILLAMFKHNEIALKKLKVFFSHCIKICNSVIFFNHS